MNCIILIRGDKWFSNRLWKGFTKGTQFENQNLNFLFTFVYSLVKEKYHGKIIYWLECNSQYSFALIQCFYINQFGRKFSDNLQIIQIFHDNYYFLYFVEGKIYNN